MRHAEAGSTRASSINRVQRRAQTKPGLGRETGREAGKPVEVAVPLSCPKVGEAVLAATTAIRPIISRGAKIIRVIFRIVYCIN